MALVGLQTSLAPGTFMTAEQYRTSARHRKLYHDLLDWGAKPSALDQKEIETFLGYVRSGLEFVHGERPNFSEEYINSSLVDLREMLNRFNDFVEGRPVG